MRHYYKKKNYSVSVNMLVFLFFLSLLELSWNDDCISRGQQEWRLLSSGSMTESLGCHGDGLLSKLSHHYETEKQLTKEYSTRDLSL